MSISYIQTINRCYTKCRRYFSSFGDQPSASMKYLLIFLVFFSSSPTFAGTPVKSTIDQRIELFSIIFRLAGNPEYNMKFARHYIADINAHFEPYKKDSLITFARQLATEKNIGFSKVMYLAVHLQFAKNKFSLIPQEKSNLDGKWEQADAEKFVRLLNSFYRTCRFDVFFRRHKKLYTDATKTFDRSVAEFDQQWYLNYYGDHQVDYRVAIGLGDGGANYGPSVNLKGKNRMVYAIMGSWTFAEDGSALFPKDTYLTYLIHEFNHSFIDHILEEDSGIDSMLRSPGKILLKAKKEEMKLEGYEDWHSLINESLVRASVVRYLIDHGATNEAVNAEIASQQQKGFVWTKALVGLLGEYESSRAVYPTFESFYPRITAFFLKTSQESGL